MFFSFSGKAHADPMSFHVLLLRLHLYVQLFLVLYWAGSESDFSGTFGFLWSFSQVPFSLPHLFTIQLTTMSNSSGIALFLSLKLPLWTHNKLFLQLTLLGLSIPFYGFMSQEPENHWFKQVWWLWSFQAPRYQGKCYCQRHSNISTLIYRSQDG